MNGKDRSGDPGPEDDDTDGSATGGAADDVLVPLGRITAHQGLNGWVKVHSDTDPRENIVTYSHWSVRHESKQTWRRIKVLGGRAQGKTIIANLAGVDSREQAQPLIGCEVAVRRGDLPATGLGEHYWTDLIGMAVVTVTGEALGSVSRLFETGANDVLVVDDERSDATAGTEILVPWVRPDVVVEVATGSRRIVVDWDPDY